MEGREEQRKEGKVFSHNLVKYVNFTRKELKNYFKLSEMNRSSKLQGNKPTADFNTINYWI